MELVRLTCSRIREQNLIPNFNGLHERALLCFTKYPKLKLYEAAMLLEVSQKKAMEILNELVCLKIIKYQAPNYVMENPFEALHQLVCLASKNS